MISFRWPVALLLALAAACSSTPPEETSVYLLRGTDAAAPVPAADAPTLGLAPVVLADYLSGNGIVLQLGDHRIHHARHHLWAEPLAFAVRLVVKNKLETTLPHAVTTRSASRGPDLTVELYIDEMHGTEGGDITLNARWTVTNNSNGGVRTGRWTATRRLPGSGYDALVRAHVNLLKDLTLRISQTVDSTPTAAYRARPH